MKNTFIRYFKNLNFKNKLFVSYLVVSIIPIIILGFYSYDRAKYNAYSQAKNGLVDLVGKMAEGINNKIRRCATIVDFIVLNERIQGILSNDYSDYSALYDDLHESVDPLFNDVVSLNDDIQQMTIYTENDIPEHGHIILSMEHIKDMPWFDGINKNTQLEWYGDGKEVIGLRRFNNLYNNKNLNLLYIKLNYSNLFSDLSMSFDGKYGILITDSKQHTIYSRNPMKGNGFDEARIINNTSDTVKILGQKYLIIKYPISEIDWNVYYYLPENAMGIRVENILGAAAVLIGICIIVVMVIIWLFSNTFVKPIDSLNKKMQAVEEGHFNVEVHSDAKDEIGQLTNRFGIMLGKINNLIEEVYKSKITQKEAELKALQAQINPHFLYNTLTVISFKAIQAGAMEINQITTALSKFYRTMLNKGKNILTVKEELEHTRTYITIQQILHDYSFDVEYHIEEQILHYHMINIIFQPIVENAILHGIDHKREGKGILRLSAVQNGNNLEFLIEDNGPGINREILDQIFIMKTKGYGLKNVHDRICIFFGAEYGVTIESEAGKGTLVKVVIPKYTAQ